MKEWLRFSVCYWHTWRGTGSDMFGEVRCHRSPFNSLLICTAHRAPCCARGMTAPTRLRTRCAALTSTLSSSRYDGLPSSLPYAFRSRHVAPHDQSYITFRILWAVDRKNCLGASLVRPLMRTGRNSVCITSPSMTATLLPRAPRSPRPTETSTRYAARPPCLIFHTLPAQPARFLFVHRYKCFCFYALCL